MDGTWSNPANWSPARVPNNDATDTYDVVWDTHAVRLDIDIPVTIRNFTFASSGTLTGAFGLNIQGDFFWLAGTLAGGATTRVNGDVTLGSASPDRLELFAHHLELYRNTILSSPLYLRSMPSVSPPRSS